MDKTTLLSIQKRIENANKNYLGYPLSKDFDYSELAPFLQYQINNVGDPFSGTTLTIDTKEQEREVVNFFAKLLNTNLKETWGYVTNGGSEGNLYGLYLARELYPNGVVYYSDATHYSVRKNLHLLNMKSILVRTTENGEVDYEDLQHVIALNRDKPVIILANYGTTMKEAKDNIPNIRQILKSNAIQDFYIHADAALAGPISPFIETGNSLDFISAIDSISISGHKFIGSPIPCGVVLTRVQNKDRVGRSISYVGTMDTTITGSRNGFTPLILWYAIQKMGVTGLKKRVDDSLALAEYTLKRLTAGGINAWKNTQAITVVFPKPSKEICNKYQLASEDDIAHIICVPGIEKETLDQCIDEIIGENKSVSDLKKELFEV